MFAKAKILTKFVSNQMTVVSSNLLQSYLHMPLAYHYENNTGKMSKDVIEQADAFSLQTLVAVANLVSDGLVLIFLASFLIWVDPGASALVIFMLMGCGMMIMALTKSTIIEYGSQSDEANSERFATVMSTLQAIKEIKAYNKENQFVEFFRNVAKEMAFLYRLSHTAASIHGFADHCSNCGFTFVVFCDS